MLRPASIGTFGDVVPEAYAGRVNGIAGLADHGASMLAVLATGMAFDASLFCVLRKIEPARFSGA